MRLGPMVSLTVSLAVAACATPGSAAAPTSGAIVDGFPLGRVTNAAPGPDVEALAAQALDVRMPGHAAIVSAVSYDEDLALVYGPEAVRSGSMTIYLFLLADGSYHATGVYCGVGGCHPWPVYKGASG